ncbi:MAG: hypothetical protein ACLFVQ_08155 [Chitinispirillaceae bacterium]
MNRLPGIILFFTLHCALLAQDSADVTAGLSSEVNPTQDCSPVIHILHRGKSQVICLDDFSTGPDSCMEVDINLHTVAGMSFRFHCSADRKWTYSGIKVENEANQLQNVGLELNSDHEQNLQSATITLNTEENTSGKKELRVNPRSDLRYGPDTAQHLEFSLTWNSYLCIEKKPETEQVEVFMPYSYPPGYGNRGAKINCAERQMFHYRSSVVMPTSGSVHNRGALINIYHILHPPKLEYGEDFSGREFRYGRLKKKKKPKKKGWLQIKPLR